MESDAFVAAHSFSNRCCCRDSFIFYRRGLVCWASVRTLDAFDIGGSSAGSNMRRSCETFSARMTAGISTSAKPALTPTVKENLPSCCGVTPSSGTSSNEGRLPRPESRHRRGHRPRQRRGSARPRNFISSGGMELISSVCSTLARRALKPGSRSPRTAKGPLGIGSDFHKVT